MKNFLSQSKTLRDDLSKKSVKGFTLIELLVTIGIFTILASVTLANYRGYIVNATFATASESLVIALREVQVYGASTKNSSIPCVTSSFNCAFGIHLDIIDPNSFVVFADGNDNKIYDGISEKVEKINFPIGTRIQSFNCQLAGICTTGLNITFKRPNPDAFIADSAFQGASHDVAIIILTNGTKTSETTITTAGQISFK